MERTCLVTKQKAPVEALLRFTVQNRKLVFDGAVKASGRGGYVIKEIVAIEKLPKLAGKVAYFLKVKKVEVSDEEIAQAKNIIAELS
jgi:predicted RNA-binding protein YlxR (DUF448 family)